MAAGKTIPRPRSIRFGPFELDVRAAELRKHGIKIRLHDQPFRILLTLLDRPGEVVLREEIRLTLWPNNTIVEFDHSINAAIQRLRDALSDSAESPKYVETVARRGYRFIGTVEPAQPAPAEETRTQAVPPAAGLDPSDLSGQTLSHFRLIGKLGSGGMGLVYRAEDLKLGREVALKFLTMPASEAPAQVIERFEREARAASALNHPNICTIYGVEELAGQPVIEMELLEGETLAARIAKGALPVDQALPLAIQIASALDAAHRKAIIHRDLKPTNIMLTQSGLKVLDFGLAKMLPQPGREDSATPVTQAGAVLGTWRYMSPEQAQSKALDERSDVFSFGAVLYEMLSGRRAFPGDSMVETLSAVLRDDPSPLDAPPALREIALRCLSKAPADRFQTMAEAKKALEQCLTKRHRVQPSIAVLPFANLSADKENEYFSDGLAEEILNMLTKVPDLKVIARTSSFAFRGKEQDIRKIAETLGVNHLLEGSVRKVGNRLRVGAQLIHAADGAHVWSERFDRDMTDIFAIQDEIGQAISEALQLRLAPRMRAVNLEAYQHYLKGQYHYWRLTPESYAKAKESFEQALAIEPNYALAHSGLAAYHYGLGTSSIKALGEVALQAKSAALKALALDPANVEAHSVLGIIEGIVDHDWESAERHHRKAMAVEPVSPWARFRYASFYLLYLRRFAEAKEQCRMGLESDPVSMILHYCMAWSMYAAREYRQAIEYARRSLEIDPNFSPIWIAMGFAQLGMGCGPEAIASFQRVVELARWRWVGPTGLACAYWQTGDWERSRECLRTLSGWQLGLGEAIYYAFTGEADAMFDALERAYRGRDYLPLYYIERYDLYRDDPRFQDLVRRMRLA